MLSYPEALRMVEHEGCERRAQSSVIRLPLLECVGRYTASEIHALDDNPRFDNSAVDGFAVVASDTNGASSESPVLLRILGQLVAGEFNEPSQIVPGSCFEIMTGAMFPGIPYDAAIKVEEVELVSEGSDQVKSILVRAPIQRGDNVRYAGKDIRIGRKLFSKGTQVSPQHLPALAMSGYSTLDVLSRPKIIIIATGDEVVPCDFKEIQPQHIRNSAGHLLGSVLRNYGAEVIDRGIVRDDPEEIRNSYLEALEEHPDVIITTGGVSVGKFDLVESVLCELGSRIIFHRVAIRPGKPVLFAEIGQGGPVCFGLPGNPAAVAATIRFFVRPFLRALKGEGREQPHLLPLTEDVTKLSGLSFFLRGIRDIGGVKVLSGQASFMVASLIAAEGWVVTDSGPERIAKGELVEWYSLW